MTVVRWVAGPLAWRGLGDTRRTRALGRSAGLRRSASAEAGSEACARPARRMATPERRKWPARAVRRGASGARRRPPDDGRGRGTCARLPHAGDARLPGAAGAGDRLGGAGGGGDPVGEALGPASVSTPPPASDGGLRSGPRPADRGGGERLGQTVGDLELIVVDDGSEPVAELLSGHRDPRLGSCGIRRTEDCRPRGTPPSGRPARRSSRSWTPTTPGSRTTSSTCCPFRGSGRGPRVHERGHRRPPQGHDTYIFDPEPHPIDSFPKIAEQNPVPRSRPARASAVRAAGGYARWLRGTQDYHLWCRLAAAGWRFAFVDRKLARYRWPEDARPRQRPPARELDELLMWFSFVLRHPGMPGPRRQVRLRLRRELDRLGSGSPPAPLDCPGDAAHSKHAVRRGAGRVEVVPDPERARLHPQGAGAASPAAGGVRALRRAAATSRSRSSAASSSGSSAATARARARC